jgi:hypothetical protein
MKKQTISEYVKENKGKVLDLLSSNDFFIGKYEGENFIIATSWNNLGKLANELSKYVEFGEDNGDCESILEAVTEELTGSKYNWGFDDEYDTCCECGKIVRTSPTSYSWMPSYYRGEWGLICEECVRKNPEEYIDWLLNNSERINTIFTEQELEEFGFKRFEDEKESGWYDRNDSPIKDVKKVPEGYDYIFHLTNIEQFRTNWVIMIRKQGE